MNYTYRPFFEHFNLTYTLGGKPVPLKRFYYRDSSSFRYIPDPEFLKLVVAKNISKG